MLIRKITGYCRILYFEDFHTEILREKIIVSDISSFSGENVKNERFQNTV